MFRAISIASAINITELDNFLRRLNKILLEENIFAQNYSNKSTLLPVDIIVIIYTLSLKFKTITYPYYLCLIIIGANVFKSLPLNLFFDNHSI